MDFSFNDDQNMIREMARKFLDNECSTDKIRKLKEDDKGYDPETWTKMAELGWMGLVIPEEYGGTGMGFLDLMIIMEEMGKGILPAPFFATTALCSLPIIAFGTEEQKKELLPGIASGERIWSLALVEAVGTYEPSGIELVASRDGSDYVLKGVKLFVPYANAATDFLVVARTGKGDKGDGGITVFVVDAKSQGINLEFMPTTAQDQRHEVRFENLRVSQNAILGEEGRGWDVVEYIIQNAIVLKGAEMSGGVQTVLEMTNQYAKDRIQFDKPIGSFQAIQHKLVDMLTDIDALKYLVYEAAWNIDSGTPSRLLNSIVKAKANMVYQKACLDGIDIHGAIGFTEEIDVSLYHIRTKANEFELGGTDFHLNRVMEELESEEALFKKVR